MISEIKSALKSVLMSFTPRRALIESMIRIDFKLGDEKAELMKLCFAPLAAWTLFVLLALIYVDPTKNLWSLQRLLQDNYLITFQLLDGRMQNALFFLMMFLVLERLIRNEYLLIALVFYFLAKSDLHFHLALAAVSGIFLGRSTHYWALRKTLVSTVAKTWRTVALWHVFAAIVSLAVTVFALENLANSGYFGESVSVNRREFFIYSVALNYFIQFLFLAMWGHFRPIKKIEPTDFPINYSTSTWFGKLRLRRRFVEAVRIQVTNKTLLHQSNLNELNAINDLSPASIPAKISKILQTELQFLILASSRLTAK